jgi:hypothetical protein
LLLLRSTLAALPAVALALLAGAALAGSSGTYIPQLGITVPDDKVGPVVHSLPPGGNESSSPAPVPTGPPGHIPAHMLDADVPVPISPRVFAPGNAWLVSNGATLLAVYAGADGRDPSKGRFVIVRQNILAGVQTQKVVDVPGAGALAITDAPLGQAVESTAQRGRLAFRGSAGKSGVLDLATDRAVMH